jgi:hypothetical protein
MYTAAKKFFLKKVGKYNSTRFYKCNLITNDVSMELDDLEIDLDKTNLDSLQERILQNELLSEIDFTKYTMQIGLPLPRTSFFVWADVMIQNETKTKRKYDKDGKLEPNLYHPLYDYDRKTIFVKQDDVLDNYPFFREISTINVTLVEKKTEIVSPEQACVNELDEKWQSYCSETPQKNFDCNDMDSALKKGYNGAVKFLLERNCPMTDEQKKQYMDMVFP